MRNFNTFILSSCLLLALLFQTEAVLGIQPVIIEEYDNGGKNIHQINSQSFDVSAHLKVQVLTDAGQKFWLKDHEKPSYLYNSDAVSIWLADNNEIELNAQNKTVLKTEKGMAVINTNTGIVNYTPKANAIGNDVIYYKIQCNTCDDDSQKTLALSFATAQKTNQYLQQRIDLQVDNYPNPFTETTVVQYVLQQDGNTNIQLYDLTGSLIKVIKTNEYEKAGTYSFELEARELPKGVYYISIRNNQDKITQQILKL